MSDKERLENPIDKIACETLILSDVHLGTQECKVEEVNFVLEHVKAKKMILNGDIIDGWSLRRKGGWKPTHTRFIQLILDAMEKDNVEVIYTRGNHDDLLGRFLPLSFGSLRIVEDYIHSTPQGDYLVLHGDVFDAVTSNHPILSHIGDIGYQTLLRINRFYNMIRKMFGLDYYSFSKAIKKKVKEAVNYMSRFEEHLEALTLKRGCIGAIVGHNHIPAHKTIGKVEYINSGDWVESLTLVLEQPQGKFEVLTYKDFKLRLEAQQIEQKPTATNE